MEEDDDIYSGYNDYNATLDIQNLESDPGFQKAVKTSYGRRPTASGARFSKAGSIAGPKGSIPPSSRGFRPTTGAVVADQSGARPMTAVRGAGFSSQGRGQAFDPLKQGSPAPSLDKKVEESPEEKLKLLEKKVNELVEESIMAAGQGQMQLALDKAKEAARKEQAMQRQRDELEHATDQQPNYDTTYSVLFNLANQYAANDMFNEALNMYNTIVKNKVFTNAGRLKVNMGNIYFRMKNYDKATKYYRMALDQVPQTHQKLRMKIQQNIGVVCVKQNMYNDAITAFEHIMDQEANFRTGFNLILCYFALGDRDKMRRTFQKLLKIDQHHEDEDKYMASSDDKKYALILEVIKNDELRKIERQKKQEMERFVIMAAKIIAPKIGASYSEGYDWCMEQVRTSQYMDLAHSLEIDKAIGFLKQRDFQQAVDTLKSFEKKDTKVAATAATNLSFLYLLESDDTNVDKYAELALQADRYNPSALTNKGNVLFKRGDYEKAREFYKEALQNDSSCVESLFNLGLCNKRLRQYEDALDSFMKLHAILRNSSQVVFHIADLYDLLGDATQSTEWFLQLLGIVPSDANILQRLGQMHDAEGDKSQAFQYYYDSYRYNPCNLSVIEWLGAYYIETQFCEKAVQYFERASIIQPNQVKWQLMVASCHRRSGNYQQALDVYKQIHHRFPDNVECLKFLVRICTDLGLKDAQDYAAKLKRAEKVSKMREERATVSRKGSANKMRSDRLGSAESGEALSRETSAQRRINLDNTDEYHVNSKPDLEAAAHYSDPLGPQPERPRTAMARRGGPGGQVEFGNEQLGDDLLPE